MLPDTGERYLSTILFEDIPEEMTDAEYEVSRSTPNYRFDATPPPADDAAASPPPAVEAEPEALEFLENVTHDKDNPVVMFATEWCEFSWSVRKMFAAYEIPYRSVDLDSVEYQVDNKGGKIRKAIEQKTGLKTVPQIYVGGTHVGGATETFDACIDGSLGKMLEESNVSWNPPADAEPYAFLPDWLHPR